MSSDRKCCVQQGLHFVAVAALDFVPTPARPMPLRLKLREIPLHNVSGPKDEVRSDLIRLQTSLSLDVERCRVYYQLVQQGLSQDTAEGCPYVLRAPPGLVQGTD